MTVFQALRALCVALFLAFPIGSAAQTAAPDYEAWSNVAQRAETAVENGRASTHALETLRFQIAEWRETFLDAQTINQSRIVTLQSQISALGTPEEGVAESEDIVTRRMELTEQLSRLRTPVVTAEEAYNRADGVINEIDSLIRERQASELLTVGPSPLNPVHWGKALEAFSHSTLAIFNETVASFSSDAQRRTAISELPKAIFNFALGLILLLKGRGWSLQIADVLRRRTRQGNGVWRFVASLFQILLPYIGLLFVENALYATGLFGLRGTLMLDQIAECGLIILVFRWLAGQLFPRSDEETILPIGQAKRAEARWYIIASAIILIVMKICLVLANYDNWSDETRASLGFPLLILSGLVLFRLGTLLRNSMIDPSNDDDSWQYRVRMARILGQMAIVVAFVGPLIAAMGYGNAAARLMLSSMASLGLFGLLLVLQGFIHDLYAFVTRKDTRDDSLIPVLLGFVLVIMSLPLLALIWGARPADISEVWTSFQEGFAIGDSRISPVDFLTFVVLFTLGYVATRLLQGAMRTTILPRTSMDAGGRNAVVSGIGYVGIFLAAMIAISSAGIDLSNIALVAGALSVGIGFGLQNIVSNFVSGIILLIERPIAEGDWIEVGGKMGYVRGISVRSTRIETFDRTDVIVPNADLVSGMVTNWTRGKTVGRVIVPVGVAYGNDTRKVEDILLKIAREHPMVLLNPTPSIVFQGFGADSMDFEIRAILRDVNYMLGVKSDMNHEIAKRFAEEGVEIPFAQRDIWIRNPEAMGQAQAQVQGSPSEEDTSS
ncbi:DUF3772 domain-containing protein [Planktotalea sp.]|uniref:DUF3772 domain-containing protein n=1 Tax=Planktotalea sp. TaxID=2029877 RepID=UPI003297C169